MRDSHSEVRALSLPGGHEWAPRAEPPAPASRLGVKCPPQHGGRRARCRAGRGGTPPGGRQRGSRPRRPPSPAPCPSLGAFPAAPAVIPLPFPPLPLSSRFPAALSGGPEVRGRGSTVPSPRKELTLPPTGLLGLGFNAAVTP